MRHPALHPHLDPLPQRDLPLTQARPVREDLDAPLRDLAERAGVVWVDVLRGLDDAGVVGARAEEEHGAVAADRYVGELEKGW